MYTLEEIAAALNTVAVENGRWGISNQIGAYQIAVLRKLDDQRMDKPPRTVYLAVYTYPGEQEDGSDRVYEPRAVFSTRDKMDECPKPRMSYMFEALPLDPKELD